MIKFEYLTKEVKPEKLGFELEQFGQDGFELVTLVVMQKMPQMQPIGRPPQIEVKFLLIFKKLCQE